MVLILLMVPSVIIADGLGDGRRLDMGVDSDIPYIGCSMSGSSGSWTSFSIGPPGMGGGGGSLGMESIIGGSISPFSFSLFMFIMPHTINMNTTEWSTRPSTVGHPVALATQSPNILRTSIKVSGFAIKKNNKADINDAINFSCCFLPLQPHPQSLKKDPIYYITRKKLVKGQEPYVRKEAEWHSKFKKPLLSTPPLLPSPSSARIRMAARRFTSMALVTASSTFSFPICALLLV
jgi:hypothetical protein